VLAPLVDAFDLTWCPGGGTRIDAEYLSPVLNLEQVDVEKLITAEVDDGNQAAKPVTA
jgi:hypothetical protein